MSEREFVEWELWEESKHFSNHQEVARDAQSGASTCLLRSFCCILVRFAGTLDGHHGDDLASCRAARVRAHTRWCWICTGRCLHQGSPGRRLTRGPTHALTRPKPPRGTRRRSPDPEAAGKAARDPEAEGGAGGSSHDPGLIWHGHARGSGRPHAAAGAAAPARDPRGSG